MMGFGLLFMLCLMALIFLAVIGLPLLIIALLIGGGLGAVLKSFVRTS